MTEEIGLSELPCWRLITQEEGPSQTGNDLVKKGQESRHCLYTNKVQKLCCTSNYFLLELLLQTSFNFKINFLELSLKFGWLFCH